MSTKDHQSEPIESASETLQRIFDGHGSVLAAKWLMKAHATMYLKKTDFPKPQRTRRIAVANQKGGVVNHIHGKHRCGAGEQGRAGVGHRYGPAGQCLYGVGCISCIGRALGL